VLGLPEIVKSAGGGGAFTTRLTVVVCVTLPLIPVIVRVDVPTGVLAVVVTVKVELPATVAGEKLAVAPVGSPLALKAMEPEKPENAVVLTV